MMPLLNSSGGTLALLCVWAAGLTLFTGWSWVGIAEKIGNVVLSVLTFATNRTRRDNTWQDDDEYEDEYDDDHEEVDVKESRRARILRGALARRKRLAEKFANPVARHTDAALFSGKRMDEPDNVQYRASGVGVDIDPDDVLFSGQKALTPEDEILSLKRLWLSGRLRQPLRRRMRPSRLRQSIMSLRPLPRIRCTISRILMSLQRLSNLRKGGRKKTHRITHLMLRRMQHR